MREIKFRAWDKAGNHWSGMRQCDMGNGIHYFELHLPDIELMQYTGLKDKNGKEIYEGDIVKYADWLNVVEWHEARFIFRHYFKGNRPSSIDESVLRGNLCINICEVIGNIYENKELLE